MVQAGKQSGFLIGKLCINQRNKPKVYPLNHVIQFYILFKSLLFQSADMGIGREHIINNIANKCKGAYLQSKILIKS